MTLRPVACTATIMFDLIGADHFARTTGEAVHAWVRDSGVHWVDWEDRDAGIADEELP